MLPPRSPRAAVVFKQGQETDERMRWLGLVPCLLWLGWRLQSLWQWGQRRRRRLDPLSMAFQQELRRRGLVAGLP